MTWCKCGLTGYQGTSGEYKHVVISWAEGTGSRSCEASTQVKCSMTTRCSSTSSAIAGCWALGFMWRDARVAAGFALGRSSWSPCLSLGFRALVVRL